jgi:hypothetical protein
MIEDQHSLFREEQMVPWKSEWKDMPEYSHEDLMPEFQVTVSFICAADLAEFCKLVGQNIPPTEQRQAKSIWFPEADITSYVTKRYKAV